MKNLFIQKKRHLVFGASIGCALLFLEIIHTFIEPVYFFIGVMIFYCVILLELLHTTEIYKKHKTVSGTLINYKRILLLHHLILPSLLYFSAVLYLFFYTSTVIYWSLVILIAAIFVILYDNVYSFYHNKVAAFKRTYYIYDIASIITLFLTVLVIIQTSLILDSYIHIILLAINYIFHAFLLIQRYENRKHEIFKLIGFVIISIVLAHVLGVLTSLTPFVSAFILSLLYIAFTIYMSSSTKTIFDKELLTEFTLFVFLVFAVLTLYGV